MKYEFVGSIIAVTLIAIAAVLSHSILEDKRLQALQSSLENSTSKGISPIAVRCAYAKSDGTICVVYASKSSVTFKE